MRVRAKSLRREVGEVVRMADRVLGFGKFALLASIPCSMRCTPALKDIWVPLEACKLAAQIMTGCENLIDDKYTVI